MKLSFRDAINYINENPECYLDSDDSGKGYICPLCGSGSGPKGTGITENPESKGHYTCWACGDIANNSVFDIIGLDQHIDLSNSGDIMKVAMQYYDIELTEGVPSAQDDFQNILENGDDSQENYSAYYEVCRGRLGMTDYHLKRGISQAVAAKFKLGFDPEWKSPAAVSKGKNPPSTPRLIIPTSQYSYIARDTRADKDIPEEQQPYKKSKTGKVHIFNAQALKQNVKPIFVVEGEIDALSIIEVGGVAIGLGGIGGANKGLIELIKNSGTNIKPLILALDQDGAGQEKEEKFAKKLDENFIPYIRFNVCGDCKDANDLLISDRRQLSLNVEIAEYDAERYLENEWEKKKDEIKSQYLNRYSNRGKTINFLDRVRANANSKAYSTGFNGLDSLLDGGLYTGLYTIGAISSLGKTTFSLQVADYIASKGKDVLIFSLEMATDELIAKSVSRHTLLRSLKDSDGKSKAYAKTTRGILTGSMYSGYDKKDLEVIMAATNDYYSYSDHIFVFESIGSIGVLDRTEHRGKEEKVIKGVRSTVEEFITVTGNRPVVLIDYLQILAPFDVRATDKQNVDKNITELKILSRDYDIPVIGISSFNRDNYLSPVNLASFKESGAIEYSSDCVIGLQYYGMDIDPNEGEQARKKRVSQIRMDMAAKAKNGEPQHIQVKVLKNRNGGVGSTDLNFYPEYNYFENYQDFDSIEDDTEYYEI